MYVRKHREETGGSLRKSQFADDPANWSCATRESRGSKKPRCFRDRRSEKSRCRKLEESDWLTYWGSRQSLWFPKTWSPSGKIFKVAPQEQLVDPESRYIFQYHLAATAAASLRACFGELSSQMTFGSPRANQSATTRRKIPHRYHSNFLAYLYTCREHSTTDSRLFDKVERPESGGLSVKFRVQSRWQVVRRIEKKTEPDKNLFGLICERLIF